MFKIVLLGESGVGKSSLFLRMKDNVFGEHLQPTVGKDSCSVKVKVDGQFIQVSEFYFTLTLYLLTFKHVCDNALTGVAGDS